jgi:ABC-2 type transport system ATP-binding protein
MLIFDSVSKSFSAGCKAVDHLSFSVSFGEIFGLLGPNGAGKTTCIRLALGLLTLDSGSISFNGGPISKCDSLRRSAVLEHHGLFDNLTVKQNLSFFADLYEIDRKSEVINDLIKRFSLVDKANVLTKHLSSGLKQRCALARAMLPEPSLLFLDEPTRSLDPIGKRELHSFIQDLNSRKHTTILIATHDFWETQTLCSSGIIINNGRVIKYLKEDELRLEPEKMFAIYEKALCQESNHE